MKEHNEAPHLRIAQKRLAEEVIKFIHSEESYNRAVKITDALFKGEFETLSKEELEEAFKGKDVKNIELGKNIVDTLVEMEVASSKREAREFINNNSIEIRGNKVNDINKTIEENDLIHNMYLVIKRGKKNYYVAIVK